MRSTNKVHLRVMKDEFNNWYKHSNTPSIKFPNGYKLQLKWDTRQWPVYLEQCATAVWLPNFMQDFDRILQFAEQNKVSLFTLYVAESDNSKSN